MRSQWTKEEIALTRLAWGLKDLSDMHARERKRGGIVVAACMGVAVAALFVLSQW